MVHNMCTITTPMTPLTMGRQSLQAIRPGKPQNKVNADTNRTYIHR